MERAKRYKVSLSVIMLDIDNFKKYNDNFGHMQGDEALIKVTKIIVINTRKEDFIARYGGEEFLLVLPNTGMGTALEIAERIREEINKATIKKASGKIKEGYKKVSVSMGIAELTKKGIRNMIHRADMALYKAKSEGKNKICVSKIKIKNKK
jgi:diguanylate cyclase (GGDEF)-like protein